MNFKAYNRIIEEGGAYGHMMNIHEDYTLQFQDLQVIIKQYLSGGVKGEVKEKTDGQALAVSYRSGRVIFARNKGHYTKLAVDAIVGSSGVSNFFNKHPNNKVKQAFTFAAKDLEKAILALGDDKKRAMFGDGRRWINVEVIWPETVNVIPYNHELLVLHNFREYDEDGNMVDGDFNEHGAKLAEMFKDINQHVQDKFTITSMPLLKLPKIKNFESTQAEYLAELNNLMTANNLNSSDRVGDYWVAYMSNYIRDAARQFNYSVQPDTLKRIAFRWAYKSLTPSKRPVDYNARALSKITDLKPIVDNAEFIKWIGATERSGELKMVYDKMIEPIKLLFLKLGAEILKNLSNFLTLNPTEAVQNMRQQIEDVTKEIERSGDLSLIDKLKQHLKTIDKLGGLDAIVPTEGLTFTYTPVGESKPRIYKFTGIFAPVNQILGSLKFSR